MEIAHKTKATHIGSCLSVVDMLDAIYSVIDIDKIKSKFNDRDRVVLSKGHSALALYCVMNKYGLMSDEILNKYYSNGSVLSGHVSHNVEFVEHSTGALGHGLSVAVGMAIGMKSNNFKSKVYCILGDGELQEGSNWEALMLASHLKLDNLFIFVDYNKLAGIDKPHIMQDVFRLCDLINALGVDFCLIDGHNIKQIIHEIKETYNLVKVIICDTVKGNGISFMENQNVWHYRPLCGEDYQKCLEELK